RGRGEQHRDVPAAHAARVHRPSHLAAPSHRRCRLRGVEGVLDVRTRVAGRPQAVPTRLSALVPEQEPQLRRPRSIHPGPRRSRRRRLRAARSALRRGHRARAHRGAPRTSRVGVRGAARGVLARALARVLGNAGLRRGHPPRRVHVARVRHSRDSSARGGRLMARALVTGGAGFIGSNLVSALLERGDTVRVLDNFSPGNRANLEGREVEIVEGALRSYERVHNAVRGTDVVYHLGALGSVPRSVQDPLTSSAVNVEGTLNVLLAARDEGVRRVVFSSSASVYGSSASLPAAEDAPPDPISPYGVAKLAAERYCISFARVYESFESVVLRYF